MTDWKDIIKTKELQPDDVNVVIYHDPCTDGRGSRLPAQKYLSTKFPEKKIDYYPMHIGANPPPGLDGKNVLICDYSYKIGVLRDLLKKVNKLLIIDHHKSAEKDLQEIDDKYKIFRMDHSGAMLTWFYFFPEIEPPLLIKYIQDRDIWTKALPNTDKFASWFNTLPFEYDVYNKYLEDEKLLLESIEDKGTSFEELNDYYAKQAIEFAVPKFCKIGNKYYLVAYVNSTVLKSDIGSKVFNTYPFVDFSVTYSINDFSNSTSFSLRSTDDRADVSEIAFANNGGGHPTSSGMTVNYVTNTLPSTMIGDSQTHKLFDKICFKNVDFNGKQFTVAYLNSPLYKHELASYLLQKRYDNVSNAGNLCMLKHKEKREIIAAVIYECNFEGESEHLIMFNDSVTIDMRKRLLDDYSFATVTHSPTHKSAIVKLNGTFVYCIKN